MYHPGNGGLAFECLEERRLLSGTNDLTQEIENLLTSGTTTGSVNLPNVTLGSFLSSSDVTISFQNISQQGSDWSGTVSVTADSASLQLGQAFSGQITGDSQNSVGLTGSYTLNNQPLGQGAYALNLTELDVTASNLLAGMATNVQITYDPGAAPGQKLAHVDSLSATITPFDNATATLTNLDIFDNGFQLENGTVSLDSFTLGNILSVTNPSATFSNIADTVGSSPTGTIGLTVGSAELFPGQSTFTAKVDNFTGTYDLASSALSVTADDVSVSVGDILDAEATGLAFVYNPSAASPLVVAASSVNLTSPLFPKVDATISNLQADSSGLSIGNATLATTPQDATVDLGGVIEASGLSVSVQNFKYSTNPPAGLPAFGGTITVGADSVSLFPGDNKPFSANVTGFGGSYDLNSQALSLSATEADIKVGSILDITADTLGISLSLGQSGENVSVSIGAATATLPQYEVSGSITDLQINQSGFSVAKASVSKKGPIAFSSIFSIQDPSITFTDFGYTVGQGANFDGDLSVTATEVDLNLGHSVSASATGIVGSISFQPGDLGHFTFSAATVKAELGSHLELGATNIQFDSAPAAGGDIAQFGSVSAQFAIAGGATLTGSGQDFAIGGDGSFVAGPTFGVSLNVSNAGSLDWPSWLPIQVTHLGVAWSNFNAAPADFTLDLSASVNDTGLGGTALDLSGSVQDAVIDVGLLEQGQFPITGLGGFGVSVSGQMFGADVKGDLFLAILNTDSNGNPIADGDTTTPVAHHYLYGGIDGGLNLAGLGGFEIRLGISQFGLLDAYVDVNAPIILDPDTGLALTNLHGGIDFGASLPSITNAKDLKTNPAFTPPGQQTLAQWEALLAIQMANVASGVASGESPISALTSSMTIDAGATLYSAYATTNAFRLDGDLIFDTTGKIEAAGTLTLGDEVSLQGAVYFDLSQVASGKAQILMYADAPAQAPIATIYGGLGFQFGGPTPTASQGATTPSLGTGLTLNGTTDSATAQGINLNNTSYTVEFWAQRADSGRTEYVIGQGDSPSTTGLQIGFDASNNFFVTSGGTTLTYPTTDNAWHHWAVSFDQTTGTRTIYLDGQPVANDTTQAIQGASTTFLIGQSGSTYFDGSVDEVRVWNVARAAADIQTNYTQSFIPISAGLVADWQFSEGNGAIASDSSGNGHTATLNGNPTWTTTIVNPPAPPAFSTFTITVTGEVDLTLPDLPGQLAIAGSAVFVASASNSSLDMTVQGTVDLDPLGNLVGLAGKVHFDDSGGTPKLYGIFALQTGQLSQLQQLGIDVAGTAVLRFNTTNQNISEPLQIPGQATSTTYTLPQDSVSLMVVGSADFQRNGSDWFSLDGELDAYFSFTTDATGTVRPLLQVYVGGNLLIGPATSPTADFTATGFLQISDAGVAADIGISLVSSDALSKAGIVLKNDLFSLLLNTTGQEVTYTTPSLTDPDQQGTVPGAGTAVDIPAAPSGTNTPEPYLQIHGNGDLDVDNAFDLSGSFTMLIAPGLFSFGLDMDFYLQANGTTLDQFHAQGGLILNSQGILAAVDLQQLSTLPSNLGFSLDASYMMEINTTNHMQSVGGIIVPAGNFAEVAAQGDMFVGSFDLKGSFDFVVNSSSVTIVAAASAVVGPLGSVNVAGSLSIVSGSNGGVYGLFQANLASSPSITDVSLNANFQFEINTTQTSEPVTGFLIDQTTGSIIPNQQFVIDPGVMLVAGGQISVINMFNLDGEFDIRINSQGLDLNAHADLTSFIGANLGLAAHISILTGNTPSSGSLVVDASLSLQGSLGVGLFSISATPTLVINTGDVPSDGIAPKTYEVALDNASLDLLGFSASGSLTVGVSNGVFEINVPSYHPLSVSFFGLGNFSAYGYIESNGQFSLTGSVGFDLDDGHNDSLYGSISVTISNSGFSGSFSGGATVQGTNVASVSGSLVLSNGYVDLGVTVYVIGIPIPLNFQLGQVNPPTTTSSIYWYSVPTVASEGSQLTLDAGAVDSSGNSPADSSYQWTVYRNGLYFASATGSSFPLRLGDPGTYTVGLSVAGLTRSSTIQVSDVAPVIQTLGLQSAYAYGKPLTISPKILDAVPGDVPYGLTYNWTITKDGMPYLTYSGPTLSFSPDSPTISSSSSASAPNVYNVTLTVSDLYGGVNTSSSSFAVFDPSNIIVNTTQDYSSVVTQNGVTYTSLRVAVQAAADSTGVTYVKFAPSLAGETIHLTTVGDSTDHGASAIGLSSGLVFLDGSGAPGVTIAAAAGTNMRLFYVAHGAALDINDLNLTGGVAQGTEGYANGGAIYADGSVNIYNSALYGNSAIGTQVNYAFNQANAYGGAIYVSSSGGLSATDDTFAYNMAKGADGFLQYNPLIGSFYSYGGVGYGGAIYNASSLSLNGNTITGNTVLGGAIAGYAPLGAGVFDAVTAIVNSLNLPLYRVSYTNIIALNNGAADYYIANNLEVFGSSNLVGSGINLPTSGTYPFSVSSANPLLGPFADHGDGVLTFSLLPGSPAIGAGTPGGVNDSSDGRGYPRGYNNSYDIGAFQTQPYIVSNTNDSGPGSLRAAVAEDDNQAPIVFAPALAGQAITLTSGPIVIGHNLTISGLGANQLTINTTATKPTDEWKGEGNANDSTGNNPGTIQGGVTYAPGVIGQAFQFNGTSSAVVVPDNAGLDTPNFTIGGWFKLTQAPGSEYYLASKYGGNYNGWILRVNSSLVPTISLAQQSNNFANATSSLPLTLNTWYYLAASYDGTNLRLYINGVQTASATLNGGYAPSPTPLVIGSASWYSGGYASALVDEFSYFNANLDPTLIEGLAQQVNGSRIFTIASGVTATISGLTLAGGRAQVGAGIYNSGTLTIANAVFSNDVAQGYAGSPLVNAQGGAIDNAPGASLTVTGSTFNADAAIGGSGINPSMTIISNGGNGRGGAIVNEVGALLVGADDTFASNLAQAGNGLGAGSVAFGGAIDNLGTAYLYGVTIGENTIKAAAGSSSASSSDGSGFANEAGATLTMINTIVADDNGASHDFVNAGTVNGDDNLVTSYAGLPASVVAVTADPQLGPLANNGGTTPTLALPVGSSAVNAGDNTAAAMTAIGGLVDWWRGNGNTLDSARGQNGTLAGGATYSPGLSGQAFSLNGQGAYVSLPASADIVGTGAFTVSAWIKTSSNGVIIQQRDPNNYNGEYVLAVSGGKVLFWTFGDNQYGFNFSSNRSVNDNAWHLITAVRLANGTGQIYIDGALDNSQASPPRTLSSGFNVYIGGDLRDNTAFFNGSIAEVALFNQALTSAQVQSLATPGLDPPTDQRGFTRVYNGTVDIGAFETQPFVVTNTNDSGPGSLRAAVADDTLGDQPVLFSPSLNGQTITLTSGPITINRNLAITGPGASLLTISGGNGVQDFVVDSGNVSISGLTIANGFAAQGGGLYNAGDTTLTNDVFTGDTAENSPSNTALAAGQGGAIYNTQGATLTVSGSTFTLDTAIGLGIPGTNPSGQGGAIYNAPSTLNATGAVLAAGGVLFSTDNTFTANSAQAQRVYGTDSYNIINDLATAPPYANLSYSGDGTYTWTNSTTDPRALQKADAGATDRIASTIYSIGNSLSISVNIADGNAHNISLYALDWDSTARSEQIQVINPATGAILDSRTISAFHNGVYLTWTIRGNIKFVITSLNASSNAVIAGVFFDPASADAAGLATFVGTDTTTQGNWKGTSAGGGLGGAIDNGGNATLINTTIDANTVTSGPGGSSEGAGIENLANANLTLANTLVADGTGGHDVANLGVVSGDGNLVMTNTGLNTSVVAVTAKPLLGPLQNNGGPTPTMALGLGSPAIDAGDSSFAPTTDQRGLPRIAGSRVDIGAYEYATPIVVTNTNDSGPGSLRAALTTVASYPGSPISFAPALTGQTIKLASELIVPNNVTIDGSAAPGLVIQGNGLKATNGSSRTFFVGAGLTVTLRDLTITGGYADNGGGIYNGGNLTVIDSTIDGNTAYVSGGGIANDGTLNLVDSTVANNMVVSTSQTSANVQGGGIRTSGSLTLEGDTISGNMVTTPSQGVGGGVSLAAGSLQVHNTIVFGNTASLTVGQDVYDGAGSFASQGHNIFGSISSQAAVVATDQVGVDPKLGPLQSNGGPTPTMALLNGSPAIDAGDPSGVPGTDQRGFLRSVGSGPDIGAYERQPFVVTSLSDSGPGSLRQALSLDHDGSPITFAPSLAHQTLTLTSTLTIASNVAIDGSSAPGLILSGGGTTGVINIAAGANVTLANLSVEDGNTSNGGGVLNNGTLTLSGVTVANNTATGNGGGIENDGTLRLIDSTVANNTAGSASGVGGGIDNDGSLSVLDSTIAYNSAYAGGGVLMRGGTMSALNSIFADDMASAYPDLRVNMTSLGHNLIENTSGVIGASSTDLTGVDPVLGTLQNNGGPTPTLALLAGSPAIDAGDPTNAPSTDQRGLARVAGAAIDIGAFESQVAPPQADPGDPYVIHEGDSLTLNAGDSLDPQGLPLTYTWDVNGDGIFGDATGVNPTLTWAQLQALGIQAQSTPYEVRVQVDDGYGGSHVVTSQSVTLTVLPALYVTSLTIAAGADVNASVDSATVTFSGPILASTLNAGALSLTLNGGPNLITNGTSLQIQQVPGTLDSYQIRGLSNLTQENGTYLLTLNAAAVSDAVGAGEGVASVSWLMDTVAPDSNVAPLAAVQTGTQFTVTAVGADVSPAPGVETSQLVACALYVSTNGGPYTYWTTVHPWAPSAVFQGQQDTTYAFYSIGRDGAGNRETPTLAEAQTFVPDLTPPATHVTSVDAQSPNFEVKYEGTDSGGSGLARIEFFVQVDGGPAREFTQVQNSSGEVPYHAIVDGKAHTYSFYSVGVDGAGNVQSPPSSEHDEVTVTDRFFPYTPPPVVPPPPPPSLPPVVPPPLPPQPTGLVVQHGEAERSYVRYVDILFNRSSGLASLISGNRIHLIKHGLDGRGAVAVPLAGKLHVVDHAIEIDFGASGIGGRPNSRAGDGYYEVRIDGDAKPFTFDRLLGDVNGDGVVNRTDLRLTRQALGARGSGLQADVNGSGAVTMADLDLVLQSEGDRLARRLPLSD